MKIVAILFALVFCSAAYAQQEPSAEPKKDLAATQSSVSGPEEARMKALEEQVHALAEEVALLRGELKALRDAKSAEPASSSRVLLASSRWRPAWCLLRPSLPRLLLHLQFPSLHSRKPLKHKPTAALRPMQNFSIRTSA